MHLYDCCCGGCLIAFRATSLLQVVDQLGLRPTAPRPGAPVQQGVSGRQFILPLADVTCETAINNVLGDLQRDAYPVMSDQRPARCTGTAMQVGLFGMTWWISVSRYLAHLAVVLDHMLVVAGAITDVNGKQLPACACNVDCIEATRDSVILRF
jgi:hypothetical protein